MTFLTRRKISYAVKRTINGFKTTSLIFLAHSQFCENTNNYLIGALYNIGPGTVSGTMSALSNGTCAYSIFLPSRSFANTLSLNYTVIFFLIYKNLNDFQGRWKSFFSRNLWI